MDSVILCDAQFCTISFYQNVMEEHLVKIVCLLVTASIISHVITSMEAVLTIYVHLAGRAITAA